MPSSMFSVYLRLIEASGERAGAALAKGFTILAFGIGVLAEIGLKIAEGVPPTSVWMFAFGRFSPRGKLVLPSVVVEGPNY